MSDLLSTYPGYDFTNARDILKQPQLKKSDPPNDPSVLSAPVMEMLAGWDPITV